jgi:hypothetical protein
MSVEMLFQEFTSLPETEQKSFLGDVLSYLYGDKEEAEWKAELDRRVNDYESGDVVALSGKQVENELAHRYGVQLRPAS